MKRTTMLCLSAAATLIFASPMLAQDAPAAAVNPDTALCSLRLAGVDATAEQVAAYEAQAKKIEVQSTAFLETYSQVELEEACPAQAELFAAAFDFAELGTKATRWTPEDQRLAAIQSNALAIGFDVAAVTERAAKAESCAFQCKRERDACLAADGCTGGWPCFCCVPCNATWLACLADCCLPG